MLKKVAVIVLDEVAAFELGTICEVFGTDRTAWGFPLYDFAVCSVDGKPVRCTSGYQIAPSHDLSPVAEADLVAVPAISVGTEPPQVVLDALRDAAARGARILSVCSGAFVLGKAGLLDGRRCTTHWIYADDLASQFPAAEVDPNVLYVEDGPILTSAGTAAGIDLCLHLVRTEHGSAVANALARRMVVPPHRDGGQAQYIEAPLPKTPDAETLEPLLGWMMAHLDQQLTVESLAGKAMMSSRTFARRFRAEIGTTPYEWLSAQRVLLARQLLEETELTVDAIASRTGFGAAAALRHHFSRRVGTTPQAYRALFHRRTA